MKIYFIFRVVRVSSVASGAILYTTEGHTGVTDLVHYVASFWEALPVVVPPLAHVKRPEFSVCLARTGCITNWPYDKNQI